MKSSGYPILDAAIEKIKVENSYTVIFSEEEIKKIVQNDPKMESIIQNIDEDFYGIIRFVSEELMSLQVTTESEDYPIMNVVKSCSYNKKLEIDFNEKAINKLIGS